MAILKIRNKQQHVYVPPILVVNGPLHKGGRGGGGEGERARLRILTVFDPLQTLKKKRYTQGKTNDRENKTFTSNKKETPLPSKGEKNRHFSSPFFCLLTMLRIIFFVLLILPPGRLTTLLRSFFFFNPNSKLTSSSSSPLTHARGLIKVHFVAPLTLLSCSCLWCVVVVVVSWWNSTAASLLVGVEGEFWDPDACRQRKYRWQ